MDPQVPRPRAAIILAAGAGRRMGGAEWIEVDYSYELPDDSQVIIAASAFGKTLTVESDDASPTVATIVQRP